VSTCISKHGEFSRHETSDEFTCRLCGVFDEAGTLERIREADNLLRLTQAAITAHRDLHRIYGNTSACSGGIGGAALTQHCGVTCGYFERHEGETSRWYDVERAYFRRQDGDPEWADYIPGGRLSTHPITTEPEGGER
jgi:hypothetical protein